MGAQIGGEIDIARLVETADEIARPQHRPQHRAGIARSGAQIAVAQVGGRKQRRTAGQIEDDVARDMAPFRGGPNASAARDEGAGTA